MILLYHRILIKIKILALLITLASTSCQSSEQQFVIHGTYQGTIPYLRLTYVDKDGNTVTDTLYVKDGYFSASGEIDGAVNAWIRGNVKSTSIDDKNVGSFFLEPGVISVKIIEDHFDDIHVQGSVTEDENQNLKKLVDPHAINIDRIIDKLNELEENVRKSDVQTIDCLRNLLTEEKAKIIDIRVKYATKNPKSYLGGYWLSTYYSTIPLDSLVLYYDGLDDRVKNSYYAQNVKGLIDQMEKVQIGKPAPNFDYRYHKGGPTMDWIDFRGKVVLLDFWAGWCVPCIESLPKIKEFYKAHQAKGLEVIGISSDRDQEKWKEAIKDHNIELWHHIYTGLQRPNITTQYGVSAIPSYIVVSREGVIVGRYTGYTDDLEAKILDEL